MQMMKTFMLMTGLTVLFMVIGGAVGGQSGMTMALVFAAVINFGSYWFSDKLVLSMYRARPIERSQAPELFDLVQQLARDADLPMPNIAVIPTGTPNAFATGRNPAHATVAVTEGLLRLLSRDELSGVLAHELAHVKHRDILIGTIAATLAGAVMWLANIGRFFLFFGGRDDENGGGVFGLLLTIVLAPIAAMLVQTAISRSREFAADAGAAKITGRPEGLASALTKLDSSITRMGGMNAAPATSHIFTVNPLRGKSLAQLFSTHPPIEERVRRLRAMS